MTKWRDVVDWSGFYQVSDAGEVHSLDRSTKNEDLARVDGERRAAGPTGSTASTD